MIENLRLDDEAACLSAKALQSIYRSKFSLMRVACATGDCTIKAVRCTIKGWRGTYLADRATGTLYREADGMCLTSTARRLVDLASKEIPKQPDNKGFCYGTQPINPERSPVIQAKREERIKKHDRPRGEAKASSKVTEAIVRQIRERKECSPRYYKLTSKQCQEMFGIGKYTVEDIRQRKTWGHVE